MKISGNIILTRFEVMDIGIHSRQEESVEIKDEMLMGLYNAELKETCLFFMPKELQHENEIKAVLDHQLSHNMAGLRST